MRNYCKEMRYLTSAYIENKFEEDFESTEMYKEIHNAACMGCHNVMLNKLDMNDISLLQKAGFEDIEVISYYKDRDIDTYEEKTVMRAIIKW